MLKYHSTRNSSELISSAEAIVNGLAPDGGLYVPADLEALKVDYREIIALDYRGMAKAVFRKFFPDLAGTVDGEQAAGGTDCGRVDGDAAAGTDCGQDDIDAIVERSYENKVLGRGDYTGQQGRGRIRARAISRTDMCIQGRCALRAAEPDDILGTQNRI